MIYIGIDPGLDGAIAIVQDNQIVLHDMPVLTHHAGKKTKRTVDALRLAQLVAPHAAGKATAVLEQVHAMPGQGVSSMYSFGMATGTVVGVLAALLIPCLWVTPQRWKKAMMDGMPKDKGSSVVRALQLYPSLHDQLVVGRAQKDGRADALLMAVYLMKESQSLATPASMPGDEEPELILVRRKKS